MTQEFIEQAIQQYCEVEKKAREVSDAILLMRLGKGAEDFRYNKHFLCNNDFLFVYQYGNRDEEYIWVPFTYLSTENYLELEKERQPGQ